MVELTMRKRAGRQGEVGLFVDSPVWTDEFASIKMDAEVKVEATTPRSIRQLKYAWALAGKISDACDWLDTKEDAMDWLLIEAKHVRRIYDPLRQVAYLRPKPTRFGAMDGSAYTRLLNRMKHIALTVVVPGLEESALKAEIEAMIGADFDPEPVAARAPHSSERRRGVAGVGGLEPAGSSATNPRENTHAS